MTQRADRVFSGRCVGVRIAHDDELGQDVTYVSFLVHRAAKGAVRGVVTIKMLGAQNARGVQDQLSQGPPVFREGEEVVLFLYQETARGLTSPVGFGHGKFVVRRDKQGRALAWNAFGNKTLFRGLSSQAESRLEGREHRGRPPREELSPDALLDMVGALQGEAESSAPPSHGERR